MLNITAALNFHTIYSRDAKLNFQHHYSSLSEIILICWFPAQLLTIIIGAY